MKKLIGLTIVICILLTAFVSVSAATNTLGDVDSNGSVNPMDVVILTRHLAGWDGYEDMVNTANSDLNADGNVDPVDPVILARHLAGWQGYGELPYGTQPPATDDDYIPGIW